MAFSSVQTERTAHSARADRPVYLALRDPALSDDLAEELRQHGWRVRCFVNLDVLRNAARAVTPLAIVLDLDLLADPRQGLELVVEQQERAGHDVPLFFVSAADDIDRRLTAVQAGGSAFFPLPLNRPALLHRLRELPPATPAHGGRILALDAPDGGLITVVAALAKAGFDAERITSARELLPRLDHSHFDLLLINAALTDADPLELVQAVRQTETHFPLPVLVLTGDSKRALDEGAAAAGVDAIVGLPIDAKDLAAIVRNRIERARGLRAAYQYLARYDPTTGLFNRRYFVEALRTVLAAGSAARDSALLYVLFSAERSAAVLIADTLRRQLPPLAMAAQVAANGIAVLLPGLGGQGLERLSQVLAEQLRQLPDGAALDSRLGLTLLTGQEPSADEAIARARRAAEQQATTQPAPTATADSGGPWTEPVGKALRAGRFRLVYQPIASLSGQPTSFYEVFVRMLNESNRDVLPQEFLPTVQRLGLAVELDQWITARALHVLEEQRTLQDQPILFLKLLPETVVAPAFRAWLKDKFAQTTVAPQRLVFEIRHRTALRHPAETAALVASLRDLGCRVALEHFGAGGDCDPALIGALRPDFVKLAPQLTSDIGTNLEHQKTVQAVTGHCRALGAHTVAALVQDAMHLAVLWRCGVEYIQGYFMQEPVDVFSGDETLS